MRCGTAISTRNRAPLAPSAPTLWNQWASLAQGATGEASPAPAERQSLARAAADAQRDLLAATEAAEAALARARALSRQLDAALAALQATGASHAQESAQPAFWSRLSPREREVLALVAQGRSNKAIADTLFVSPNTVKTHVAALLAKLEVDTRVQLAALAARNADWPEAA